MSEVDRLGNSGLYPVLPIADQERSGGHSGQQREARERAAAEVPGSVAKPVPDAETPHKTLIDEYA
jgi:hypothetical protein